MSPRENGDNYKYNMQELHNYLDLEDDNRDQTNESLAMTQRDSRQEQSNNIFETLQNNIDQFKQHELVINANDYVSFKQTSNKKSKFFVDGQSVE